MYVCMYVIISRMAEVTVAKFYLQIEYIKWLAFDDRLLANGHGQVMWPIKKFSPNDIFDIGEERHFKFRVLTDTLKY